MSRTRQEGRQVTSPMALVLRNNPKWKTNQCSQTPLAPTPKPAGPLQQGMRLINNSLPWAIRDEIEASWREPRAAPRLLPQKKYPCPATADMIKV